MGIIFKKDPQRFFEAYDFTVTRTICEPPALSLLPAIYQDERSGRWSVRFRGAEPTFFSYADVLSCHVVEMGAASEKGVLTRRERLAQVISNPAQASRANAMRRNACLGLGVVVEVRTEGGVARLEIPVISQVLRRDSTLYRRMVQSAENLKAEFDAMANAATAQRTTVGAGEK